MFRCFVKACSIYHGPITPIVSDLCFAYGQFIVMLQGVYESRIAGRIYHARKGEVLYFPPGLPRTDTHVSADPVICHNVCFNWADPVPELPYLAADTHGRMRASAEWLAEIRPTLMDWQHQELFNRCCLSMMIAEYMRLARPPAPDLVQRVRQHVSAHLDEALSLDDLAVVVEMNKFCLARRFKELTGQTVMQEVRRQRLARAEELLIATGLPLKAIAQEVGLSCEVSLCHFLRKYAGVAPGELRAGQHADG